MRTGDFYRQTSHLTPHSSHLTPHTLYVTRHTSHVKHPAVSLLLNIFHASKISMFSWTRPLVMPSLPFVVMLFLNPSYAIYESISRQILKNLQRISNNHPPIPPPPQCRRTQTLCLRFGRAAASFQSQVFTIKTINLLTFSIPQNKSA